MSVELPPPSPELVLWRVLTEAMVEELGRKRGERLLRTIARKLSSEESLSEVMRIRPASDDAAVAHARRQAMAFFRQTLPRLMGGL